jgi:hypothetical protein
VWVDDPREIYPSYDDVVISVYAPRGCYAAVFVIDDYGYIHVIHPFSPYESAWIRGGFTYRFGGRDLGLDVLGGRGIAHVFAIGSHHPFDFTHYGTAIFAGGYGYRVYGDPYVASRQLYVSLLPVSFRWNRVGVGFARFYVREWVRYPVYLCHGNHGRTVGVRIGDCCRQCYRVYDRYRVHVHDPIVALSPQPRRYKDTAVEARTTPTRIERSNRVYKSKTIAERRRMTSRDGSPKIVSAKRTDVRTHRTRTTKTPATKVVRATGAQQTSKSKAPVVKKTSPETRKVAKRTKTTDHNRKSKTGRTSAKTNKTNQKGKVSR